MIKNKLIHTVIESAVKNGIRYISDNPKRGVRNLLDLGEYFASGRFQKSFFDLAHEILNNEDSFYYDKIEDLVANTNHDTIKDFGINLGYNSFTYGARIIREHEQEPDYKIPWTIIFDFREENREALTEDEIVNVIQKGKSFGIYCYIFLVDSNDILSGLYPIIKRHNDCAISLILSPNIITEQAVNEMSSLTNLCFFLLINDIDEIDLKLRVDYLRSHRCLYGACYYYGDSFSYDEEFEGISKKLISIQANFALMIQRPACDNEIAKNTYDNIYSSRFKTDSPAFLMDLYEDINQVGNTISEISKETHFLSIDSTGQISLNALENKTQYNIRRNSCEDIFKIQFNPLHLNI